MECPVCNAPYDKNYVYCGKCGFQVRDPFPHRKKVKEQSQSEKSEKKPLEKIKICELNAYLSSYMDHPDLIDQLFLWLKICSGSTKLEFCNCTHCKGFWSKFSSRAHGKGDYDLETWKETQTINLEGIVLPMFKFVKSFASPEEKKEENSPIVNQQCPSTEKRKIPQKCPQCKSSNTDMDSETRIHHCLDCGSAWEYLVRHRIHIIQ